MEGLIVQGQYALSEPEHEASCRAHPRSPASRSRPKVRSKASRRKRDGKRRPAMLALRQRCILARIVAHAESALLPTLRLVSRAFKSAADGRLQRHGALPDGRSGSRPGRATS